MTSQTMLEIERETSRAAQKHPHDSITVSTERAAIILGEECGEVQRAVLDMTRPVNPVPIKQGLTQLYVELTQVGSVVTRWMKVIEDRAKQIEEQEKKQEEASAKTQANNRNTGGAVGK